MRLLLAALLVGSCAHAPATLPPPSDVPSLTFVGTKYEPEGLYVCGTPRSGEFSCITLERFLDAYAEAAPKLETEL